MGRQITRVPPDFEHPRDEKGNYIEGAHYDLLDQYKPEDLTCIQIYENTSPGTPVSPVFANEEEAVRWLTEKGYSEESARAFLVEKYASSFVVTRKGMVSGIEALGECSHARAKRKRIRKNRDDVKLVFYFIAIVIWAILFFYLKRKGY